MADSTVTGHNVSFFGYLFWKWLIYLLLTLPAFGITLLAASIFGQTGGTPGSETGFLRFGPAIASFLGHAVFLFLCYRVWRRLKLGKMTLFSFVLRESCAYAGVLLPCVLVCAVTKGNLLFSGGVSLVFLPHLPFAFFGAGWYGAFLSLVQLPIFAGLAALAYQENMRTRERKIETGEEAIEGQFTEKTDDSLPDGEKSKHGEGEDRF